MATLNTAMNDASRASQPATGCVALATGTLATTARGLFITTAGNITFTMQDGSEMALTAVPVGHYPFTVRAISVLTAAGYALL
jgi:hypothetical protein